MKTRFFLSILAGLCLMAGCSEDSNGPECSPLCDGRNCGPDGCGGVCGICTAMGTQCGQDGVCTDIACIKQCSNRQCGSDGCGGVCGYCAATEVCSADFKCVPSASCKPDCTGKQCGSNGCGGVCGYCGATEVCSADFQCLNNVSTCTPDCTGKQCGSNGCGGVCGYCGATEVCSEAFKCVINDSTCTPSCTGKQCGDNGCGGSCGSCPNGASCNEIGICETECTISCTGKQCGDDGCGGVCGFCPEGSVCDTSGICQCTPDCTGKQCGDDGCGGSCGTCTGNLVCENNRCETCKPDCNGKQCGDDGCGGSCGTCTGNLVCENNRCETCKPHCTDRACGGDGCGGTCGQCEGNTTCNDSTGQCMPWRVKGRILIETQTVYYDDYQLPKLDKKVDIPGSDIPIALYDAAGSKLGEMTTDSDGGFEFALSRLPISTDWLSIVPVWKVNGNFKLGVYVFTPNKEPYDLWAWNIKLSNYAKTADPGMAGDIRITVEQASGALFLYHHITKAYKELADHHYGTTLNDLGAMGVLWNPGKSFNTNICPGTCYLKQATSGMEYNGKAIPNSMWVGAASGEESAWGYPTLLHEFGHFVLFQRRDSTPGGAHYINHASDPRLAWSEGFATLFSLMAMSWRENKPVSTYWRVINSGSYWIDYAKLFEDSGVGNLSITKPSLTADSKMKQDISEAWVTHLLWEFFDGKDIDDPNTPPDKVKLGAEAIFDAIRSDRYLYCTSSAYRKDLTRSVYGTNLVEFLDALICQLQKSGKTDIANDVMDLTIQRRFPYDRSPVCPQ